jgi:hypothetical protein
MAAIEWADVVGIAGNLANVSALGQAAILAYVNDALEPGNFGGEESPKLYLARILLAAHFGELNRRASVAGAQGGTIASKTIGTNSITIQYAQQQTTDSALKSTEWGAQYRDLLKRGPRLRVYSQK